MSTAVSSKIQTLVVEKPSYLAIGLRAVCPSSCKPPMSGPLMQIPWSYRVSCPPHCNHHPTSGPSMKNQPRFSRHLWPPSRVGLSARPFPLVPFIAAAGPVPGGERFIERNVRHVMGPAGEGTMIITHGALMGDRSVAGLARLIAKTMPEDAPGSVWVRMPKSRRVYL